MMNEFVLQPSQMIIQSPPGDTLLETLEARGMTQAELALRMGRPLKTVNEIIKGKTAITPETALQLERVLGISAEFWINREQQYRTSQARQAEQLAWQQQADWLASFPLQEMHRLGWLKLYADQNEQFQELLRYLGLAGPEDWSRYWLETIPNLEQSHSYQRAPASLTTWLRQGELQAQQISCRPYQTSLLRELTADLHELMDRPAADFYPETVRILSRAGVAFCVVPGLPELAVQRFTRRLSATKFLLQINASLIDPLEFWHSVYHGLGHILLHGKRTVFLDEAGQPESPAEMEAERFASEQIAAVGMGNAHTVLNWDFLIQTPQPPENPWPDFEEAEPEAVEPTNPLTTGSTTTVIDLLAMSGWPGLSTGARRALLAAGLADEAGRVDEQLFVTWFSQRLTDYHNAYNQGYLRDAAADLENIMGMVRVGKQISPALGVLEQVIEELLAVIKQPAQQYLDPALQMQEQIQLTTRPLQKRMVSVSRRAYSTVATRTESSLAEQLFQKD